MRPRLWIASILLALLAPAAGAGAKKSAGLVDLNSASVAELMALPGMTTVWAARIVRFRPYRTKLDLMNEGVVPAGVYESVRESVVARRNTYEAAGSKRP
jgi:competence protein ComEA